MRAMTQSTPLIWALLGKRTGDNNQVLALAEELGLPFEPKYLGYRRIAGYDLGRIKPKRLGASLLSLDGSSRAQIRPPWPDLVIGAGKRNVPIARHIRKMSGGKAKLVRIGNPRTDPKLFDLVVTTPQYEVPAAENVLKLPVAMSRFRGKAEIGSGARDWLESLPRPHLLLALGGNTRDVEVPAHAVADAARKLAERASSQGGSALVVGSPRTGAALLGAAAAHGIMVPDDGPSFAALLDDADQIFVTADSISMLSEAIVTRKPVGMVPAKLTEAGLKGVGEAPKGPFDNRSPMRDPRNFWSSLERNGLVGTVDCPRSSDMENPVTTAARAVRKLLGDAG